MKQKISVTVEKSILTQIDDKLKDGLFRNKSHIVEYALRRFLKGD